MFCRSTRCYGLGESRHTFSLVGVLNSRLCLGCWNGSCPHGGGHQGEENNEELHVYLVVWVKEWMGCEVERSYFKKDL